MVAIEFPSRWSVLKNSPQDFEPYYYSMAYTDDHLGFQLFLTDFDNVWTQSLYYEDIIKAARHRNIVLSEEDHVREIVGVLNGCLFQQYYDNESYQKQYKSELTLIKANPYDKVSSEMYLYISAKNDFKWDFDLTLLSKKHGSNILKLLNFNLFNIVYRMDLQSQSLVDVIHEKDRCIQYLMDLVSQLNGDDQLAKFKNYNESSKNALLLQNFEYDSWVKRWKRSKLRKELNPHKNEIWNVIDYVSKDPDLWEFSTNYHDALDKNSFFKPRNEIAKTVQNDSEFATDEIGVEVGIHDQNTFVKPDGGEKSDIESFDIPKNVHINTSPPSSPTKIQEKSAEIDNLSQSFHETIDMKSEKIMKIPSSPSKKLHPKLLPTERLAPAPDVSKLIPQNETDRDTDLESECETHQVVRSHRKIMGSKLGSRPKKRKLTQNAIDSDD